MLASAPATSSITPFVPAGGALLLLLAAGILLWALGGKLLRPGLAIIGLIAGMPLGIWVGGAVAPEVPPVIFAAGGALAGLVIACLSYVLALAAVTAVLTGIVALMGAWSAADMGWIDASKAADRIDQTTQRAQESMPSAESSPSLATLTHILLGSSTMSATEPSPNEHGAGESHAAAAAPATAEASAPQGVVARTRAAIEQRWSIMPRPLRTLLLASLAAGTVVGFLFGLLCSKAAAQVVTSLAGSIILLVAGVPLLSAALDRTDDLLPARPAAWFVAIALLTIIGVGVQRLLAPPPKPQPQPQRA